MPFRKSIAALAVLFSLSAPAAFGLGSQSAQQEAAPADAATPVVSEERIRAYLLSRGVDLDSQNGKVQLKWMQRVYNDPLWLAALSQYRQGRGPNPFALGKRVPPPDSRMQLLRAVAAGASGADEAVCSGGTAGKIGKPSLNEMTPELVDATFAALDALLRQPRDAADERYSTEELLEAEGRAEAGVETEMAKRKLAMPGAASGVSAGDATRAQSCAELAIVTDAIFDLPEPQRSAATWDFFTMLQGGKLASDKVLADPSPYFDEVFDDRALPQPMRDLLPPDGSRPLPFKRLIIAGEWVNKDTPGDTGPFNIEFVNRHDNGVVSYVMRSLRGGTSDWAHIETDYGVVPLRSETVSSASPKPLSELTDGAAISLGWPELAEGSEIEYPGPQPYERHVTKTRCKVGHKRPASTVFPSLTGDAIDLSCTDVVNQGKDIQHEDVWLVDYGIQWTLSIVDEDGLTRTDIKNITVSK